MAFSFLSSLFALSILVWQGAISIDSELIPELVSAQAREDNYVSEELISPSPSISPAATILPLNSQAPTPSATPAPTPQASGQPTASPSPEASIAPSSPPAPSDDCDFEYHYDSREDGAPPDGKISIDHKCRRELENGTSSNELDIDINTGSNSSGTESGRVKVDVQVENN